jgi:tetratricopeptide (TPR) repeat protein
MIVEKRYNEALLLLAEVIRKDPERIDEAESLIRRIRIIRGDYNNKYEELINVLYEQRDVEKALEIIRELEALDANPNPVAQSAVLKAKDSALFIFNQNRFNDIMTRAAALLDQKNYWEAVGLYLGGFDLGKESFDRAGYGNIIETRVNSTLGNLSSISREFVENNRNFLDAYIALKAALTAGNPATIGAAVDRYVRIFRIAGETYKTALRTTRDLEEQNSRIIMVREGLREDFFLGYTQRLASGRKNVTAPEGIKGAAELFLRETATDISKVFHEKITALYNSGETFFEGSDLGNARRDFETARQIAAHGVRASGIWYDAAPVAGLSIIPAFWDLAEGEIERLIHFQAIERASGAYIGLVDNIASIRENIAKSSITVPDLKSLRTNLLELASGTERFETGIRTYGETLRTKKYTAPGTMTLFEGLLLDLAVHRRDVLRFEIETVDRIAAIELAPLNEDLLARQRDVQRIAGFVNGTERSVSVGESPGETIVVKFPAEALIEAGGVNTLLQILDGSTRAFVTVYQGEVPEIVRDPQIAGKIQRGLDNLEEIRLLRQSMTRLTAAARESVLLADQYKAEGTRRIAEAEAAIRRNNFEIARTSLAAARQRFSLSLSLQENPNFRKESDTLLLSLDANITDAENKLVVAEVRTLINEGKRLYSLNNFEPAEDVLLRAQARWRMTQAEDNQEVQYWLGFVRAALFVKSNREILVTDPLYVEMSQLLNLAREDFIKGRDLIQRGNRREALESFNRAEEKLRQVSITFPFNQESAVLALRIAQLKDRENFSVLFRNKFREAQGKMATNPQEGYIDMKDLEQIDPNFAGLKDAIYRAEITLGIRLPPPDPRALAESQTLYGQAFRIVSGNVRSQFPIALEQLNRAIELDPNNQRAIELKDRIQIDGGGQTSVVLSSIAEEQYRLAEKRFIEGNFFEALAIVQRLLQNRESRNYPPLQELKRRIESRI